MRPRLGELALAGYAVTAIAVALTRVERFPDARWAIGAHLALIGLLTLFQHPRLGRIGHLARDVAPIGLLLAVYGALDLINGYGAVPTHDVSVQRWESWVFGEQISQTWWRRQPSSAASALFHSAYFGYYLVVPFPVGYHLIAGRPDRARRATDQLLVCFALCYAVFLLWPVAGPYYEFPRPAAWFTDNPAAAAVYGILSEGSSYGAAFPSSHVAATWVSAWATWPGSPRWAAGLLVAATLLTIGVVYCQMHYGVDALAGLGVAAVTILMAGRTARDS